MTTPDRPVVVRQEVVVTDLRMPFLSMVVFMVKWAIAAIPALLILTAVLALAGGAIVGAIRGDRRAAISSTGAELDANFNRYLDSIRRAAPPP